jgi:hypothetical protein
VIKDARLKKGQIFNGRFHGKKSKAKTTQNQNLINDLQNEYAKYVIFYFYLIKCI